MMHRLTGILAAVVLAMAGRAALADVGPVPFFFPAATSVDPEVSVLAVGVMERAQPTASVDRKYVTIDMAPRLTGLQGFRTFTFQRGGGQGFVGSAGTPAGAGSGQSFSGGPNRNLTPSIHQSTHDVQAVVAPPSLIDRPGMTLIAPAR